MKIDDDEPDPPQIWSKSTRFDDGKRKIDFVLVTNVVKLKNDMEKLVNFMEKLVKNGIEFETSVGNENRNLVFIKLHVPEAVLMHFAQTYHIILEMHSLRDRVAVHYIDYKIFHTVITKPDIKNPLYHRAEQSLSGRKPRHITSNERSLILYKLLRKATYSDNEFDRGTDKLIKAGILIAAYPIHDSSTSWPDRGPISDRQLLLKYWANLSCWYKNMPLNLIYKYYGSEVGFYFAFYDFYIKMLVPAALLGLFVFIFNIVSMYFFDSQRVTEICDGGELLCPVCLQEHYCGFKPIREYCTIASISAVFDSGTNIIFAIFMSFWSTVLIELWKRREMQLKFSWNLLNVESANTTRLEFYQNTKYRKLSKVTGKEEPYVPTRIKIFYHMVTVIVCLFIAFFASILVLAVIMYRLYITKTIKASNMTWLKNHLTIFTMCTGALLNFIFIKLFSPLYMGLAKYLTDKENPKTFVEYYNSIIYKAYLLSFVNMYFPIFYLAFVKDKLYSYPGNKEQYVQLFGIRADICPPTGCTTGLTFLLLFILGLKASVIRFTAAFIPYIRLLWRRTKKYFITTIDYIPVWEKDFKLHKSGPLFMTPDYMELSIQYGLVTFFVAALPLGPLLGLMFNLVEMRLKARMMVKANRRPIGRKMPGLGAWNNIFRMANYLGTVTNALVIAFTSEVVNREIYRYSAGNLDGYINSTLSVFHIDDFPVNVSSMLKKMGDVNVCHYRGDRNPYYDPQKYELADDFWHKLAVKLGFVIFFEQIIWVLQAFCAASISDRPTEILQQLNNEQNMAKAVRFNLLTKTMGSAGKNGKRKNKFKIE